MGSDDDRLFLCCAKVLKFYTIGGGRCEDLSKDRVVCRIILAVVCRQEWKCWGPVKTEHSYGWLHSK